KKTPLYDFHLQHGGKIVPFAGWALPIQYTGSGLVQEHLHTRQECSLFDVSHMLQLTFGNSGCVKFLESLIVTDVANLPQGRGTLSVFTNENGGIIDDLIVSKISDESISVVSNAACSEKVVQHIQTKMNQFNSSSHQSVDVKVITNRGLLALQGPKSAVVLQRLTNSNLSQIPFMGYTNSNIADIDGCFIARGGYTGEDGFEISVPSDYCAKLAQEFLKHPEVKLAGLGARDSLRLEAGLCLYGNDIDEETTPIEAGLAWTVGKARRNTGNFPGSDTIIKQLQEGPSRKRVGLISTGPPARGGTKIFSSHDDEIGIITSGSPSPSLKKNIAMGYIKTAFCKIGTEVQLQVRNKKVNATIARMPFLPSNYYNVK
ncbi:uncharacterized protein TRIADDRAFT_18436, partial [Trichoplax adhaerens]